jgi:hypothetical protein
MREHKPCLGFDLKNSAHFTTLCVSRTFGRTWSQILCPRPSSTEVGLHAKSQFTVEVKNRTILEKVRVPLGKSANWFASMNIFRPLENPTNSQARVLYACWYFFEGVIDLRFLLPFDLSTISSAKATSSGSEILVPRSNFFSSCNYSQRRQRNSKTELWDWNSITQSIDWRGDFKRIQHINGWQVVTCIGGKLHTSRISLPKPHPTPPPPSRAM